MILVLPDGKAQRGGLVACENDTWTLTIANRANDLGPAPTDFDDMLALAKDFIPQHVQPALERAQPLTEVSTYRHPGGVWRRYDQITRHPKGFLVIGNALCCLDPINGQGMTMATLHVDRLRKQIRDGNPVHPQAFYKAVAAVIKPVWITNANQGSNRLSQRATQWIVGKILEAAAHDIVVTERLVRIANFVDPPQRLFEPAFLGRIVAQHARRTYACCTHRSSGPANNRTVGEGSTDGGAVGAAT
jgi:hypothetical protein